MKCYPGLEATIEKVKKLPITPERQAVLQGLIRFIQHKKDQGAPVLLNFICTHNSRRSQLSQIWAQTIADKMGVEIAAYSGGVEITAFNERAIAAVEKAGFKISQEGADNPRVKVLYSDEARPIVAFSKKYDDASNPAGGFATIMTCSHADENCPFIPGAEARIPLRYDDPKDFDGTPQEAEKYDERSCQIAAEMIYVFANIN